MLATSAQIDRSIKFLCVDKKESKLFKSGHSCMPTRMSRSPDYASDMTPDSSIASPDANSSAAGTDFIGRLGLCASYKYNER